MKQAKTAISAMIVASAAATLLALAASCASNRPADDHVLYPIPFKGEAGAGEEGGLEGDADGGHDGNGQHDLAPANRRPKEDFSRYLSSWGRNVLAKCVSIALGTIRKTYTIKSGITVAGFEIEEIVYGVGQAGVIVLVTSPDPSWFRQGDRSVMFLTAEEGAQHVRAIDKIDMSAAGGAERLEAARRYVAMEAVGDPSLKRAEFKKILFSGLSSPDRWLAENAARELYILTEREPELFDGADSESLLAQSKAAKGAARENLIYCVAHVEVIPPLRKVIAAEDEAERAEALKSVASLFDPEGKGAERLRQREDAVFQLYRLTDDPAGRAVIVVAAAEIGTARLVTGVYKALWDSSQAVRAAALRGLRKRGTAAHAERVTRLLSDPFPEVRLEAVLTLARVGDKSTLKILDELVRNESELSDIRAAAARVAAAMRGKG